MNSALVCRLAGWTTREGGKADERHLHRKDRFMKIRYVLGLCCILAATNMGLAAISVDASVSVDQARANTTVVTSTFSTTSRNELLLAFISPNSLSTPTPTVAVLP